MAEEDQELIAKIALGGKHQEQAMLVFFDQYAARIKLHFLRHRISTDDASDLLQEVMIKVMKGAPNFRIESKVSTWVWTITNNTLMDFFRQSSLNTENIDFLNESVGDSWQFIASHEQMYEQAHRKTEMLRDDCVEYYFGQFSEKFPQHGQALRMKAFDGLSIPDIAKVINRNEGATREFLSQGRKKLKDFLQPCNEMA